MSIKKKQREAVLEWIAEGLESGEINKRAAKFKPPFKLSKRAVTHYRKSRQVDLEKLKEAGELEALKSGLALKDERVKVLQSLANRFISELIPAEGQTDKLWLLQVKGIGGQNTFERIEYYEFNKAEVDSLRGVLDDIAAEVGERVKKSDVTSDGNPIQPIVNVYIPKNNRETTEAEQDDNGAG